MKFEKIKYMYECFLKKHTGMYSLQTINSCPFSCSVKQMYKYHSRKLVVTAPHYKFPSPVKILELIN